LTVYYGSQTGTAESFAQQIEREGPDKGFLVHVIDLEDISVEQVLERKDNGVSKAIFLVATYGEGEPTDNSAEFIRNLKAGLNTEEEKKEQDVLDLQGLEFCVFGLGNRQYEHFNAMGKTVDDRLGRAGAKRIIDVGLGDDDSDLEGDFENWKDNVLWPGLTKLYVKDASCIVHKESGMLPDCPYIAEYSTKKNETPEKLSIDQVHGSSRHYFTSFDCPVSLVRELRSSQDPGSTVHMEIDVSKVKGFSYQTADNLGVLPVNDETVVKSVADALGLDLDTFFSIKAASGHEWHGAPFPMPISVNECLSRYCDLTSAPRRSELKLLAAYAHDSTDKKALLRMSSKEGKAEYREKIMDAHVGLVDLLKLCPSVQMPLEHFLGFCPRLLPRYYTISSSSSVYPNSVHLTVAVTESVRQDGSAFRGVCSSYLAGLDPKTKPTVRVFCRESTFRLPKEPSRPILMVGPGTGIAPMRALLQERSYQRTSLKQVVGPNVLYFGCKKRSMDYLYKEELDAFRKQGDLDMFHIAFSREQKEKVYVQHLLSKNGKDTWNSINGLGASIFVCGGVKMGHDVTEVLKDICIKEGNLSPEDAKEYLKKLASEGRFVQELWA
jgi:NADPH-ferrihemoprotein reductase